MRPLAPMFTKPSGRASTTSRTAGCARLKSFSKNSAAAIGYLVKLTHAADASARAVEEPGAFCDCGYIEECEQRCEVADDGARRCGRGCDCERDHQRVVDYAAPVSEAAFYGAHRALSDHDRIERALAGRQRAQG